MTNTKTFQVMEHFKKGDKVIYSAADGEYFATVIRVNRGGGNYENVDVVLGA